jgi:hypothetical protein
MQCFMQLSPRARRLVELVCVVALLAGGLAFRHKLPADRNWRYAGSDSYGYMNLAHEWREHGRYALAPPPEPLSWSRVPGYPLFLMLVFPDTNTNSSWDGMLWAQQLCDLITALLVWLMARRLAGPIAGLLGLAVACFNPFTPPFCAAMLTEIVATTLTAAATAAILLGAARPTRWWPLAGALLGASTLVRQDGLILAVAFVPPLFALPDARTRLRAAAAAALGFVVVFGPWPLRNQLQLGHPYISSTAIDRFSRPVDNYAGYWAWLRSWAPDWNQQTFPVSCFYDTRCSMEVVRLRSRGAFDDVDDEREVQRLIAMRDARGLTPEVSTGFSALAAQRLRAHPFRVGVARPLSRAWHMWVDSFDELYQGRLPWPSVMRTVRRYTKDYARAQFFAVLAAAAYLVARRRTRVAATTLALPIVVRTVILAWTFYCMPRYAIEVMPLGWVLVSVAAVTLATELRDLLRRRRSAA